MMQKNFIGKTRPCSYLGRELEKVYLSLHYAFPYVQDSAPSKIEEAE